MLRGVVTVRLWLPPPQVLEHFSQPETTQSTGHGFVAHGCASDSDGQDAPVPLGSIVRVRLRLRVPVPHVLEQESNAPHCETTQSTGHSIP